MIPLMTAPESPPGPDYAIGVDDVPFTSEPGVQARRSAATRWLTKVNDRGAMESRRSWQIIFL
jgi:hypothetical protein